jgi:hypothetical protein
MHRATNAGPNDGDNSTGRRQLTLFVGIVLRPAMAGRCS